MQAGADAQRLFFALWPPDPICHTLNQAARRYLDPGLRFIAPENIHATLLFLGKVDGPTCQCLVKHATDLRLSGFSLRIDTLGAWPRARVAWAAPSMWGAEGGALVDALRRLGRDCGQPSDERHAFRAHLTLARGVRQRFPRQSIEPLDWRVDTFHLVASKTLSSGAVYTKIGSWPLVM